MRRLTDKSPNGASSTMKKATAPIMPVEPAPAEAPQADSAAAAIDPALLAAEAPPVVIPLTTDQTKTYRGVLVHVEYWVPLPEQWELTREALLEVHFSHSPVLIERLSSMTASINGNGINSVFLSVDNAHDGVVTWAIRPEYLKLGENNVIEITAKMRSDLELCDDVHSPALWMTLEKSTQLIVRYREKPIVPNLAKFPGSYLRPELFYADRAREQTHAIIAIPKDPSADVLTGVGVISARIGADTRFPAGALKVRQIAEITPDLQAELAGHNLIIVGPTDFVNKFAAAGLEVVEAFRTGDPGLGHLFESPNPWNPGRRTLVVGGADDAAIAKAVTALSLPQYSKEWETAEGQPPMRGTAIASKPEIPASALEDKLGTVTISLADLGSSDLTQRGKFHHFVQVAFPNPYVGRIEGDAFIRLVMSHSELLVAQTSSLLVKINGEPVRSIRLSPRTAKRLEADIVIPQKFYGDRTLVTDLEFFLDIGDPDCRYNFPEMAWVSIFNSSFIAFPVTDKPSTSLRSYPWVAGKEPNLNGLMLAVGDDPSDESLSVVANIAAYLGKKVPRRVGVDGKSLADWVHPWVKRIGSLTDTDLADRDLVVVGDYPTVKGNAQVLGAIPESMFADTVPADNLLTYTGDTFRADAGWVFLGKSPWNARRNLLVVSGSKGEPAFEEAGEYLWVESKVNQLAGSAVLVGSNGALEVTLPAPGEDIKAQMGPLTPQLPAYDEPRHESASTTEGAKGEPTEPPAAALATEEGATASGGNTAVTYLVFGVLGLLLLVLVVVRVRDTVRSQPPA